jgi:CubicO group peptidase (beta-lactamase class C family)
MPHQIRQPAMLFLLLALAIPARANHDTPATILGYWDRVAPRLYMLQPARTVRPLPASGNRQAVDRVAADAKSYLANTLSLLLIENGEVLFEGYANGATRESPLRSYSMTKSFTALAVGEALCAGKIRSLDDKAAVYAPALEGTAYGAASVRNLLKYTSGAEDPGGDGYTGTHSQDDFRAMLFQKMSLLEMLKKHGAPGRFGQGEKFIYNGLDSQALGFVVRGATGLPLQRWFEETVWQKAGAEFRAGWFMDREGNGVAEILLLATSRDFARIGIYVQERLAGKVDDPCVSTFLRDAARPHTRKGYWNAAPEFGMGIHVGADGNPWIMGHGAQRIGMNVKTGRLVVTNGSREWTRSYDNLTQGLLAY